MKTRVVRYWYGNHWLHKVEVERIATGDEKWLTAKFGIDIPDCPPPVVGSRYWAHVDGCLSWEKAVEIAEALADSKDFTKDDVVAEFGE
jgi:hypothetical protein